MFVIWELSVTDIWHVAIFGDDQTSPLGPVAKGKVNKISYIWWAIVMLWYNAIQYNVIVLEQFKMTNHASCYCFKSGFEFSSSQTEYRCSWLAMYL